MKNIIIAYLFFGCNYPCFAANLYEVNQQAKDSFNKEYPDALYAKWETLEDNNIYAVRFIYNNQSLVAYYDNDGTDIGFARLIATDNLPVKIKEALNRRFADYRILVAQELVLNNKHVFYFNAVRRDKKLFIGIYSNGKIKQKKKVQHL